ncbi:MAG: CDGSH iron-sulfur domain-containing protein [Magnetococcales bacterium]|nr:CDGSH iron-sulfur domain-containing protein [Magnetococcales bacterium]
MFMETPLVLDLPAGEHYICMCGRSANGHFCDGSHQGTGLAPRQVVLSAPAQVAVCTCRKSGNAPHCDGSHA